MRLQAISLFFASFFALAACGGGGSGPVLVTDLSTASQIDLCEAFLDDFCADSDFCDDPCVNEGCQAVVENGDVDAECVGVFDDEVIDCGIDGSEAACAGGPGCIADALETVCNGA
jgi:hypothetical protein